MFGYWLMERSTSSYWLKGPAGNRGETEIETTADAIWAIAGSADAPGADVTDLPAADQGGRSRRVAWAGDGGAKARGSLTRASRRSR
jgi:hypothetical protein